MDNDRPVNDDSTRWERDEHASMNDTADRNGVSHDLRRARTPAASRDHP